MGGWGLCKKDLNEISPSGEPRTALKKDEKIKEGDVKNKITINPTVTVEEIKMSRKEYSKIHKDFKSDDPKNPRTTKYVKGKGTVSMPVKFTDEYESKDEVISELDIKQTVTNLKKGLSNWWNRPIIKKTPSQKQYRDAVDKGNSTELNLNSHQPEGEMVENTLINKIKNDFNIVKKAKNVVDAYNKKLQQNNDAINQVLPGTASMQNNSYEPESEMVEDAKMARQSDDALSAAHKKFSSMDPSPANKFMLKRITKEMNRRNKKVDEELNRNQKPFYQKKYTTGGYKTVGTNKRMNSSSDRKKAGTVDSKASHRSQMKDFADAGIIKKGKSGGGMKKGLASLKKESLLDQVAGAYVDEATRMKKEMGYDKGGTKKPKGPKAKDAALDAIKAKYKGQIMRSGSNQPKKVKGQKPSGGGKFKMMADKKKETAADAKKRGFKNTQDYVNTMARYGGKDNYDKGKGLGT
jgi:hypothetical protein